MLHTVSFTFEFEIFEFIHNELFADVFVHESPGYPLEWL